MQKWEKMSLFLLSVTSHLLQLVISLRSAEYPSLSTSTTLPTKHGYKNARWTSRANHQLLKGILTRFSEWAEHVRRIRVNWGPL
jgi:hypothetical protein